MKSLISDADYKKLIKAISTEFAAGTARLQEAFRREALRINWSVGRHLNLILGLDGTPSARNAAIIGQLATKFDRRDSDFYDAAKFYRLYPELPTSGLSYTHYQLLIRVEDPILRRKLELRAVREGLNSKDLRALTRIPVGQVPLLLPGMKKILVAVRGILYHYRTMTPSAGAASPGRVTVDAGFFFEREVRGPKTSARSGLIVRIVKEKGKEVYTLRIANPEKDRLYTYKATVIRVIDGDTLDVCIDIGFYSKIVLRLRLRGINAPEITTAAGRRAKRYVEKRIPPGSVIVMKTYKYDQDEIKLAKPFNPLRGKEKFGRFLADVYYGPKTWEPEQIAAEGMFLNQELLDRGLVEMYEV